MEKDLARREKFGTYLRSLRNALGMSQRQVGETIGMSFPYLAQIERGERMPSQDKIARLAEVYAVSKEVLLQEAGYLEGQSAGITTERIQWAFEAVCRDNNFRYGTRVRRQPLDVNTKALICEIYVESTGRQLFKADESEAINALIQSNPPFDKESTTEICRAFVEMVTLFERRMQQSQPQTTVRIPDILDCFSTAWECREFDGVLTPPISPDSDSPDANSPETSPNQVLPERAIKMRPVQAQQGIETAETDTRVSAINPPPKALPLRNIRMNPDAPQAALETPQAKDLTSPKKLRETKKGVKKHE